MPILHRIGLGELTEQDIINRIDGGFSMEDAFEYEGVIIPVKQMYTLCNSHNTSIKGIEAKRLIELAKKTIEKGIVLTPLSAKKLAKMEHKGKADKFLDTFTESGFTKCEMNGSKVTEEELTEKFLAERRFHNRTPRILPQIAAVCDYYDLPTEEAVSMFSIEKVRNLLDIGVSKVEVVLLYMHLTEGQLNNVSNNLYLANMVSTLIDKSYGKSKPELMDAAIWIANHPNTNIEFLEKVYKNAEDLILNDRVSIDNIEAQFSNQEALSEVKKIEKAYKKCGFKLENCVCELKKSTTLTERYKAEILEGDDPRQVMLGYDTDCCQHLEEAGESAMMHGLLHPKAGFWVVTKRDSNKVVAEAEVWELDKDTLVFDNIEFANDAEIDQYKEIIGKWILESPYKNIIMGCGYNALYSDEFEHAGEVRPDITPYEAYVLSYEEDAEAREEICELPSVEKAKELLDSGEITYFDYIYCDSERSSVYLKKNYEISSYFNYSLENQQQQILQHYLETEFITLKDIFAQKLVQEYVEKENELELEERE